MAFATGLIYNDIKRLHSMRPKIWIKKSKSFSEAQHRDDAYYLSLSSTERLETVQFLREEYKKLNKDQHNEIGKRLRRVLTLIKHA
jgi:hypothetical protein